MIRKKRVVKLVFSFLFSILLIINFGITAFAGVNGAEPLGTVTITEATSGSPVNGYYKTSGYDIEWSGNMDPADGVFRHCADNTNKYFYAAEEIDPGSGQGYFYLPAPWPAIEIRANLGEITSGAVLLHTVTGVAKPDNVNYSYHVNSVASIPNHLTCVYAPPQEAWVRSTEYRGVLTEVQYYIKLASSNIVSDPNGDNDGPSISLTSTPTGPTFVDSNSKTWSKEAIITATITDNKSKPSASTPIRWRNTSGLIRDWGKGSNTSYSSNDTIVTDFINGTTNTTYTVDARDGLLNTSTATHAVNYIDTVNPTITGTQTSINNGISFNGKEYTKTNVTLSVVANDSGCGFPSNPYSWDGGNTWTNQSTYTVTSNKTVHLLVRDGLNNSTSQTFVIDTIDKVAPVISTLSIEPSNWRSGDATISIVASDNITLSPTPYSWDGGNTWTNLSTKKISDTSNLNIQVRDLVGNITTSAIAAKKESILAPLIPIVPPVGPIIPPKPGEDPIVPPKPTVDPITPPEPNVDPIVPPKPEEDPIVPTKPKKSISNNSFSNTNTTLQPIKTIALSAGVATGIVGLFFILFMIFGMVKVYADTEDNEEKYLGRARIKRKSGTYHIPITHSLLNKADTSNYKLKFHKVFSKRKADSKLLIALPKISIDSFIQDVVPFQYD